MHVYALPWVNIGVELVVQAFIKLAPVGGIQHIFANTCLTIGRLTHDINHASGDCSNDLLVVFQQSTIRFPVDTLAHREILFNDKGKLLVRERILFHTDQGIAYPRRYKRFYNSCLVVIPEAPVLIHHKLFAGFITEVKVLGAFRRSMVCFSQDTAA